MLNRRSFTILTIVLTMACLQAYAKSDNTTSCTITLPSGSWTGATQNNVGNISETNTTTSITSAGSNRYIISDFSGGFIGHFGFGNNNQITIEIDCNNLVTPSNTETPYGMCHITGGSWDPTTQELIIQWTMSNDRINEATKFTLN